MASRLERALGWGPEIASALVAAVASARVAGAALAGGFPLDDAWIHMVYGRAAASGDGLAYNAGVPGTGATSPLWAAIAALSHLVVGAAAPPVYAAIGLKVSGVLAHAAASIFAARLARRCSPDRDAAVATAAALAAGALVAASPLLAFGAVSGMEVAITSALLLGAFVSAADERAALAGLFAGLAACARPEAAVAAPVALGLALRGGASRRRVASSVASAAWLPALWTLRNLVVSGRPLPATVYAKSAAELARTQGEQLGALGTLRLVVFDMLPAMRPVGAIVLALDVVAVAVAARALVRRQRDDAALAAGAAALTAALHLVGLSLHTRFSHAGSFYYQRYLLPVVPLVVVAAVATAVRLLDRIGSARARLAIVGAATVVTSTWEIAGWREQRLFYADAVGQIDGVQVRIGRLVDEALSPDAVVWSADAGAIRYFGRRRTLDLGRLNTPELLRGADVDAAWAADALVLTVPAGFRATVDGQAPRTLADVGFVGQTVQIVAWCPPGARDVLVHQRATLVARGACRAR